LSEDADLDSSEWEQVSFRKMVDFSFGYVLVYFMGGFFSRWVFYYYQVELGLPVVLLGIAMVIFIIWNAINDPLIGYLTDRPFKWSKKYGFRAPWMMIGVIPYIIFWWLLFAVPDSIVENSDPWPLFWYFIIMSCLFDTFYSLFSTHINAGFTTYFSSDAERRRSSAINTTIPVVLQLFIGFMVPLVYVYGNRDSMILAQTLVVLLLIVCVLILIPGIRETEIVKQRFLKGFEERGRDPYLKTMKKLLKQRNYMTTVVIFTALSLGTALNLAAGIYMMKDVLRLPLYPAAIYTGLASFIGYVFFIPFWANVSKKYGHAKTMRLSCILICLVYIPNLWITTLTELVILVFFGGLVSGSFWVTLGPVSADTYDENTISTGKHQEAVYTGFTVFFNRLALIAQTIILTIVFVSTEYNPDPLAVQTDQAIWGIRIIAGLIPSLTAFLAFVVMYKWFDLIGEKQVALKKKLREMGL